jgi:hypothetical protein
MTSNNGQTSTRRTVSGLELHNYQGIHSNGYTENGLVIWKIIGEVQFTAM